MGKIRNKGEKILNVLWNEMCDFAMIFAIVFVVALGYEKRLSFKIKSISRIICDAIATVITTAVLIAVMSGSFVRTGCLYFLASIQKRLAIMWASSGDWAHPMTGGRYEVFRYLKDELIESDKFAKLLNDLAGHGFVLKFVQILLIIGCITVLVLLIAVLCKCVKQLVINTRQELKAHNCKIVSIRKWCNRRHNNRHSA